MLQSKFWQGFFAITPILIFVLLFIGYFLFLFSILNELPELEGSHEPPSFLFAGMGIFIVFIILTIVIGLGSLIFYIIHATQNPNLKDNNLLIVWVLLFIFLSGIGQLIYWIVEILSKQKKTALDN